MISPEKQTKVFADTAEIKHIYDLLQQNLPIDGVTTNPSLLAKALGGIKLTPEELDNKYYDLLREIRKILPDGSISGEIFVKPESTKEEIYRMANEMSEAVENIHVKIPIFPAGLEAAADFVKDGGKVNMTLCFSLDQARAVDLLTEGLAKKGQVYVSPFVGRLDDIGLRGMSLIENIHADFTLRKAKTCLLAASIRSRDQFDSCMALGIDMVTVPPKILFEWNGKRLKNIPFSPYTDNLDIKHPLTDKGFNSFVEARESLLK